MPRGSSAGYPIRRRRRRRYDAATLKKKRDAELANGRLAMLGMAAFIAGETIPGSVPALSQLGFAGDYAGGLPFAPF